MSSRRFRFLAIDSDPEAAFVEVDSRRLLAARRTLLPGRSLAAQASLLYVTLITFGLIAILFWGIWGRLGSYLGDLARPYHLVWGPAAILLLIIAILRYNTLQGFVSFSEPDCAHLLTAPVRRSGLTWPRLRSTSIVLGCAGALVGLLAGVVSGGAAASGRALGQEAACGFALGVILVAAGWQVQRSTRISKWVIRLTLPALAVVILLIVARDLGARAGTIVLWSGPWGWAILPSATHAAWQGWAGVGLLWVCAIAGVVGVLMSAGRGSLEGFQRRARTRSRVVASLYSFDARSALRATRQPRYSLGRLRIRPRAPRRPSLALAWRGLLALLRSPLRLGWGIVLGAGAALMIGIGNGSVGASWGGALLLYLAASSLLEPLRAETDSPAASHLLLPWSFGRVLWLHCLLPAVILLTTGIIAALAGFAAGRIAPEGLLMLVILWIPVAPSTVLAAALSSRKGGRASTSILTMTSGDSTGLSMMVVVASVFGWTIAAIVVVALGVGRVMALGSPVAAVVGAFIFGLVVLMLRSLLLSTKSGVATEGAGSILSKSGDRESPRR